MAPDPPPYGTSTYWDERFKTDTEAYDWLEDASILDADIKEALKDHKDDPTESRILHIGSGTSRLSLHLREFVKDPGQVQHVDFSHEAVEWGRRQEKSTYGFEWGEGGADIKQLESYGLVPENLQFEMPMMRWTRTSLLELESVIETCSLGGYQVIVDKSCCDAIACASWVTVPVPFFFCLGDTAAMPQPASAIEEGEEVPIFDDDEYSIHPINLLAIHLALVAPAGAQWIALSYSKDRWPFLPDEEMREERQALQALPKSLLDTGFPDPGKLWKITKKEPILHRTGEVENPLNSTLQHWKYVLERTEVELKLRGS